MSDLRARPDQIDAIVESYRDRLPGRRTYLWPDIPAKKLHNAISTYAADVTESDVVALLDGTVTGNAKDGALLTATDLYGHEVSGAGTHVGLGALHSVAMEPHASGAVVKVDGRRVFSAGLVDETHVEAFADLVQALAHPDRPVRREPSVAASPPAPAPAPASGVDAVHEGPEVVPLELSHLLSVQWHSDALERTSKARFATSPLWVTRPVEGEQHEHHRCPQCHRELEVVVASHAVLRERMRRAAVILLVGAVLVVAGMAAAAAVAGTDSTALLVTVMGVGMVGALVATIGGVLLWEAFKIDRDHGVKVGALGENTRRGRTGGWAEHSISLAPKA